MSISNLFLSASIFVLTFVMLSNERGTYLEHAQIPLYGIIVTEMLLVLLNKKLKNPLLDILNLIFIIFYLLRIPFTYGDFLISDIYMRGVDINSVDYSLYVLNYQLIILAACILILGPVNINSIKIRISNGMLRRILNFTAIILTVNAVRVIYFSSLSGVGLPSIIEIFFTLFNYSSVLLILVPLLFMMDSRASNRYKVFLYGQLIICVLLVMISGSKSGVFQILGIYLVTLIVRHGSSFKIRIDLLCFLVLFIMPFGVAMFLLGDIFNKIARSQVEFNDWYELFIIALDRFNEVINSFSYRIGYLDFFIDKTIQEIYSSAFRLELYFKALVDAVTPGFDVWGDVPLVSRSVYNNYFGISEGPNSEAVTVFGEAHHLAGFFSFIPYAFVLGAISYLSKLRMFKWNEFSRYIGAVFIGHIFYRYMHGYGIDFWLFGDVLYPLIGLFLTFKIVGIDRNKIQSRPNLSLVVRGS